jgi:D-glycero-D-manno-heptose 1,7-bisphosphate phosphatase
MDAAVFLDRDGTLIEERHYLCRPEGVALFQGAATALRGLLDRGFKLFIVSNQSGVGRGYFTMADVEKVNARVLEEFALEGVYFAKIYIAPEAPDVPSRGRKPSPQFLFDARDEFGIDLSQSWIIGDKLVDLQTGWNAGMRNCILVRTGYGAKTMAENPGLGKNLLIAEDLPSAATLILSNRPPC